MIHELAASLLHGAGIDFSTQHVHVAKAEPILQTRLRAAEVSAAVLTAQATLVNQIWTMRTGRTQSASLDMQGAALAMQSVFHQQIWNYPIAMPELIYPTVDLYPTKDGRHIMIDGGYPLLRNGFLDLLGCTNNKKSVGKAILGWPAATLEQAIADKKLPGVMVRSEQEWLAHPQGKILAASPAVELTRIGDAPPKPFPRPGKVYPPAGLRPLSGLRILDLTHVIAGPTCAKVLACEGATPLHIYSPSRPTMAPFDIDTGHGKLSAFLDVKQPADYDKVLELAKSADVFAQSYRPGAISGLFSPEKIAALRPGIIYVSVSCFGGEGPWQDRPGWEHLGQAAAGIAVVEGSLASPKLANGFYPNDYTTGNLAALGVMAALIRRATEGGSWHVRVSLTRTAMLILEQGLNDASAASANVAPEVLQRFMMESDTRLGRLHFLGPIVRYSETASRWDLPTSPLGVHPPVWPAWIGDWAEPKP
jgi:crotonobetainyl-CoA:carnitine CoA-transferase CaiB-like acyl-CoA transferase